MKNNKIEHISKTPICLFALEFLINKKSVTVDEVMIECQAKITEFYEKVSDMPFNYIIKDGNNYKAGEMAGDLHSILTRIFHTIPRDEEIDIEEEKED